MKKHLIVLMVVIFSLCTVFAFAADKSWFVIKDKNGVCKVIEAKEKTPKTIGGPFSSQSQATKFKESKCPAAKKPKTTKPEADKPKATKTDKAKKDTKAKAKDKKKSDKKTK